ncbi:MAG: hypothetical protein WCQ16_03655 [Verrucomicrobiae bacterium]
MKKILLVTVVALMSSLTVSLALDDIQILPTRKRLDEEKARTSSNTSVQTKEIVYSVKVTSGAFKELQNVTIKYNIFYEAAQLGSTAAPEVKTATGIQKFPSLLTNKPVEFDTTTIQLSAGKLDPGWYFKGGGKSVSKDKVVGLWFKAFDAEGKQIGEYVNPASVTQKRKWKE